MSFSDSKRVMNYFKIHIDQVTVTCKAESHYVWNHWKEYIDPLINLSEALDIDTEELKRAKDTYVNAQMHLLHVKEAQIVKIKNADLYPKPTVAEDLT